MGTVVPKITEHQARHIRRDELHQAATEVRQAVDDGIEPEDAISTVLEKYVEAKGVRPDKGPAPPAPVIIHDPVPLIKNVHKAIAELSQRWDHAEIPNTNSALGLEVEQLIQDIRLLNEIKKAIQGVLATATGETAEVEGNQAVVNGANTNSEDLLPTDDSSDELFEETPPEESEDPLAFWTSTS